ncbi:NADH-dependent alcohol dehydrogenase, partial [Mesorhizobium sp. M00.F.Ca.ET.186.01.1.1]
MENFVYYNPTQLIFGRGQLAQLEDKAKQLGSTVLLVYGG